MLPFIFHFNFLGMPMTKECTAAHQVSWTPKSLWFCSHMIAQPALAAQCDWQAHLQRNNKPCKYWCGRRYCKCLCLQACVGACVRTHRVIYVAIWQNYFSHTLGFMVIYFKQRYQQIFSLFWVCVQKECVIFCFFCLTTIVMLQTCNFLFYDRPVTPHWHENASCPYMRACVCVCVACECTCVNDLLLHICAIGKNVSIFAHSSHELVFEVEAAAKNSAVDFTLRLKLPTPS